MQCATRRITDQLSIVNPSARFEAHGTQAKGYLQLVASALNICPCIILTVFRFIRPLKDPAELRHGDFDIPVRLHLLHYCWTMWTCQIGYDSACSGRAVELPSPHSSIGDNYLPHR